MPRFHSTWWVVLEGISEDFLCPPLTSSGKRWQVGLEIHTCAESKALMARANGPRKSLSRFENQGKNAHVFTFTCRPSINNNHKEAEKRDNRTTSKSLCLFFKEQKLGPEIFMIRTQTFFFLGNMMLRDN